MPVPRPTGRSRRACHSLHFAPTPGPSCPSALNPPPVRCCTGMAESTVRMHFRAQASGRTTSTSIPSSRFLEACRVLRPAACRMPPALPLPRLTSDESVTSHRARSPFYYYDDFLRPYTRARTRTPVRLSSAHSLSCVWTLRCRRETARFQHASSISPATQHESPAYLSTSDIIRRGHAQAQSACKSTKSPRYTCWNNTVHAFPVFCSKAAVVRPNHNRNLMEAFRPSLLTYLKIARHGRIHTDACRAMLWNRTGYSLSL